ncbi:MAG: Gfo/Idh/MocA family oxidoreductase [Faecalibacterium sp.]|nr:Gfo/Idh/MocA family oxidoreductase [Faecalibacterium sp.]
MNKVENKIRYGIVGFGAQGASYARILTGTKMHPMMPAAPIPEHCLLGAICDTDPAKREAAAKAYPDTPIYDDYKTMIASGDVDAIITTVPHYLHHEMAIYAMENGMHVIGEKPAGVRASDVQKMIDCSEAHPEVAFGIMFNQRTNVLYQKIKALVASGELGEMRRTNWIINTWWRPDSYYAQSDWRATWGGEGGGVLVNQAPHQLDLWQWICGVPCEVTSVNINGAHRNIAVENDVTILTKYPNGATGTFITCTHDAIGTDRLEIDLDKGKIVVEGSKKCTVYRMKQSEQEMNETMDMMQVAMLTMGNSAGGGLYDVEEFENNDAWGIQHGTVMENFALHVLTGSPLLAPGADGILGVRLANASQLSAWTGKTVPLPCDEAAYNAELNKLIEAEGKFPVRD